jgi:serine/threonine-protein kinase RsbW
MENDLVLEIPTDVRSIQHTVEYVMQRCRTCEAYQKRLHLNFRVGLTEALTNAMLYGNEHDPSKHVRVEVALENGRLEARITDQGGGFDPSAIPDPTEGDNILKSGGRGLFLMRQLLDEVSFNDRGNQVTLVLRLEQGTALEGGAQA